MMIYTKGVCVGTETFRGCGNERYLVNKTKKLCQYCNSKRLAEKKPKKENTGELEVFKMIWAERPHKSQIDGTPLLKFDVRCFSHILSKGAYPKFRLLKQNIVLKTFEQHQDWEFHTDKLKEDSKWDWVFELKEQLKQKYYERNSEK